MNSGMLFAVMLRKPLCLMVEMSRANRRSGKPIQSHRYNMVRERLMHV